MKVGFLQQANSADLHQNILRLSEGISDLAKRGAELIVLQELHNSLYFCQVEDVNNFDLAEPIPGPSTKLYGELAKQFGVVIVTSLFERRAAGLYHNTAVVLEKDGSIAGIYRKMHIPDDPAYYEKFYFTPGDLGFHPIQTSVGCLGVMVCWDQWYPEAARLMALQLNLSHCYRLCCQRHTRRATTPAQSLADGDAWPCCCQRASRLGRQPCGFRV